MNFDSLTCKVLKKVACGIIIHNNKILVSQRSPAKKDYPMFWEFTGGRFENNETVKQCIEREIKEELNIFQIGGFWSCLLLSYFPLL